MSIEEMNKINARTDDLDVRIASPHKFNGCGLIISSEVIKAGVNIPKSVFFVHDFGSILLCFCKFPIKILYVSDPDEPPPRNQR